MVIHMGPAADYYLTDLDYPVEAHCYVKKIPSRADGLFSLKLTVNFVTFG